MRKRVTSMNIAENLFIDLINKYIKKHVPVAPQQPFLIDKDVQTVQTHLSQHCGTLSSSSLPFIPLSRETVLFVY